MGALLITILATAMALSGCANTTAIQPTSSSKSQFEDAVYKGESVTINTGTPGAEEFRVFHQGATGFVSVQSVRESAEQRATEFCARSEKSMKPLRETASKPPHILGNFPRVEIVFACVAKPSTVSTPVNEDPKYTKLVNLKKLLDSGVLSKQEFEAEKAKVLSQP